MISCDECQRKLVAILDNEGTGDDEKLISLHLRDCLQCRAFQEDIVKLRQRFVSIPVPGRSASVQQEVMQVAQADSLRKENRGQDKEPEHKPLLLRFPRLAWVGVLAAVFLIAASWLVSFNLAQKVKVMKQELEICRRDIALVREKEQLKEAQEREQKAIAALYFRMQELEKRFDRYSLPRTTFLPAEQNRRSDRTGDM